MTIISLLVSKKEKSVVSNENTQKQDKNKIYICLEAGIQKDL